MTATSSGISRTINWMGAHSSWVSRVSFIGLLLSINTVFAASLSAAPTNALFFVYLRETIAMLMPRDVHLWLFANGALMAGYCLSCWHYARPLADMRQLMSQSGLLERPPADMIKDMVALMAVAKEQSYKRHELTRELEETRHILAQYHVQQQAMLRTTSREIMTQYQSVLSYANYLDEHIQRHAQDEQLRYDFDDACESSFTLKLIADALELLRHQEKPDLAPVPLAALMQQTLLALAPSLDRRAMALTTAEVDETVSAHTDAAILTHVVWMMLLGLIRYAAAESTLQICCLPDEANDRSLISIVVNELAPGAMSQHERAAHLIRQMQHGSPHMFAETIRIHGNLQLAELLLTRLDANISVVPLSPYACEICLSLPMAKK